LPAGGRMLAVNASAARLAPFLADCRELVSIAAINGPDGVVISGDGDAIAAMAASLGRDNIRSTELKVSHAFHSPLMEPMLDEFEAFVSGLRLNAPRIGIVSNLTGRMARSGEMTTPNYWRRHVREAVRFEEGIRTLSEQGYDIWIEIGPAPVLLGMAG